MREGPHTAAGSIPDEPYLSALEDVEYCPVFIMGDHRSGTTILYKLLALTECFNIVTAYHTLRYDELLVNHAQGKTDEVRQRMNELFGSLNLRTRMIDDMELNADLPEEYCMVLHARSKQLRLTRKNMALFDELCKKIQHISDPTRLLLLKNPWDFSNFMTIKELVPNAKFVFIHRHPLHTLNSQLMAMRKSWTEGNPYAQLLSKTYSRLQKSRTFVGYMRWMTNPHSKVQLARRILTLRARRSMEYFFRNIELLPRSDFISVRYEDLCDDSAIEIRSILDFLGVKARAEVNYKRWIKPRPLRHLPGVERVEAKLRKRFHKALVYHGYEA